MWAQASHLLIDAAIFTSKWQEQGYWGESEHEIY
jgi:hypothetical protein